MKKDIVVLGMDPRIGFSILKYDYEELKYHVLHFSTLHKTKFSDPELKQDGKIFDKNLIFLEVARRHVKNLMETYQPDICVTEDSFYQYATSYRLLTSWISTISLLLYNEYRKHLHTLSPKTIKKIVTGNAEADKDMMYETIVNDKNIVWYDENYKENLTEHSVDAIGCAIAKIISL